MKDQLKVRPVFLVALAFATAFYFYMSYLSAQF